MFLLYVSHCTMFVSIYVCISSFYVLTFYKIYQANIVYIAYTHFLLYAICVKCFHICATHMQTYIVLICSFLQRFPFTFIVHDNADHWASLLSFKICHSVFHISVLTTFHFTWFQPFATSLYRAYLLMVEFICITDL